MLFVHFKALQIESTRLRPEHLELIVTPKQRLWPTSFKVLFLGLIGCRRRKHMTSSCRLLKRREFCEQWSLLFSHYLPAFTHNRLSVLQTVSADGPVERCKLNLIQHRTESAVAFLVCCRAVENDFHTQFLTVVTFAHRCFKQPSVKQLVFYHTLFNNMPLILSGNLRFV